MPWEKKFDNDDVLEKAMQAFWARGYAATSMQDLTDCMGINRGSIYATFTDKRSLFLQALEHYEVRYRRATLADIAKKLSPREAIVQLFNGVVEAALNDRSRRGCMLVNTAIELSAHDDKVAEAVARGLDETRETFLDLVRRGQASGDITTIADAGETASTLLGLMTGLRVLARSRPERHILEPLARQAIALLD